MNAGPDQNRAFKPHGLRRISNNVEDGLNQEVPITINQRNTGVVISINHHSGGDLDLDQLPHPFQHLVNIDRLHRQGLVGSQHPVNQKLQSIRFVHDDLGVFPKFLIHQLPLQKLG